MTRTTTNNCVAIGTRLVSALIVLSLAAACSPQRKPSPGPAPQAQDGVAVVNSVPGPMALPKAPEPRQSPPPIIVAEAANLPPAPDGGLTMNGWGPIRIGMTLDELNAATGSKLTLENDPEYGDCTFYRPEGIQDGLSVMFSDGRVVRIDVSKARVATYGALRTGMTAVDVRRVFGTILNAQPHFYDGLPAEYLTVWTIGSPDLPDGAERTDAFRAAFHRARGLRFETDIDGKITEFRAGDGSIEAPEGCQ